MLRLLCLLMLSLARADLECQGNGCPFQVNSLLQTVSVTNMSTNGGALDAALAEGETEDSTAYTTRLRDAFATMLMNKVNSFCGEVRDTAAKWVVDAKREAMEDITKDCRTEGHLLHGCGLGIRCKTGQCVVRKDDNKGCFCKGHTDLEKSFDAGTIDPEKVVLNAFSESSKDLIKYKVVQRVSAFSAGICENEEVMAQINGVLVDFEKKLCTAISTLWLQHGAQHLDAAVDTAGQLQGLLGTLEDRMRDGLGQVASAAGAKVTDTLKFLFAPAASIPHVGPALHEMLVAQADVVGSDVETELSIFFQDAVNNILKEFYKAAAKAKEHIKSSVTDVVAENEKVMEQLEFVFSCTGAAEQIPADMKNTIAGYIRA